MPNSINWFELPTIDFDRASAFYSNILGAEIQVMEMGDVKMGMLPNFEQGQGVGGHISHGTGSKPSADGALVYLNGGADANSILNKVEGAGGKVIMPKSPSPGGFMGMFLDTEGNRVAVHNP